MARNSGYAMLSWLQTMPDHGEWWLQFWNERRSPVTMEELGFQGCAAPVLGSKECRGTCAGEPWSRPALTWGIYERQAHLGVVDSVASEVPADIYLFLSEPPT